MRDRSRETVISIASERLPTASSTNNIRHSFYAADENDSPLGQHHDVGDLRVGDEHVLSVASKLELDRLSADERDAAPVLTGDLGCRLRLNGKNAHNLHEHREH